MTKIHSKWFEPRSISSSYVVIVRVRVVLKRTVVGDWRFDNLSGSHLQSQVNSVCHKPGPFNVIGQFSYDGFGWKTRVNKVCHQSLVGFDPSIVIQVGRLGPCIVKSFVGFVSVLLPLRLSKRQSSTTVLFRTTLTRTITTYELLILLGSKHLLWIFVIPKFSYIRWKSTQTKND